MTQISQAASGESLGLGASEFVAISLGSVLPGAASYIGPSPNFIVKAIVEQQKAHALTFFGFVFKFTLPVLYLVGWFQFRH